MGMGRKLKEDLNGMLLLGICPRERDGGKSVIEGHTAVFSGNPGEEGCQEPGVEVDRVVPSEPIG